MKKIDMFNVIAPMNGWCTTAKAGVMYDLVLNEKPSLCLEIGVYAGRSLIAQAAALQELGSGRIIGIDPWRVEPCLDGSNDPANDQWWSRVPLDAIEKECIETIWKHGLEPYAIIVRSASQFCANLFAGAIDILHIDGCHSELSSTRDVQVFVPQVRPGGFIWMDDTDWATTKLAVQMVEQGCEHIQTVGSEGTEARLYRKR